MIGCKVDHNDGDVQLMIKVIMTVTVKILRVGFRQPT